jgi:hypothetical protein
MSSDGGSFSHISFHICADWRIHCSTYPDRAPILGIDAGSAALNITPRGNDADEAAVEFARALVREVQAFAAEIERLHAESTATDPTCSADQAA